MGGNVFDQSTFDRQKLAAGGGPQTDFLGDVNSILAPMYINLLRSRVGFPKAAVSPPHGQKATGNAPPVQISRAAMMLRKDAAKWFSIPPTAPTSATRGAG